MTYLSIGNWNLKGKVYPDDPYTFGTLASNIDIVHQPFGQDLVISGSNPIKVTEKIRENKVFDQLSTLLINQNGAAYDIFCLEEVSEDWVDHITAHFGGHYHIIKAGVGGTVPVKQGDVYEYQRRMDKTREYMLMLIKNTLPLEADLSTKYQEFYATVFQKKWAVPARAQIVKVAGVWVVHVHAPGIPTGDIQQRWYTTLGDFLKTNTPTKPMVLIGDFNMDEPDKINNWLGLGHVHVKPVRPFFSSFHKYVINPDNTTTVKDPIEQYKKVDQVFVSPDLANKVIGYNQFPTNLDRPQEIYAEVPSPIGKPRFRFSKDMWPSDHLGQYLQIQIPVPKKTIQMGAEFIPRAPLTTSQETAIGQGEFIIKALFNHPAGILIILVIMLVFYFALVKSGHIRPLEFFGKARSSA